MSYKIESITATIPVTGQSYTDLRPMVSADSMEDYREALSEVGRLAGNDAFTNRMTNNKTGKEKICTDQGCLYLDRETHEYEDEDGNKFISGSTWAGQFEKPFAKDLVAKQVAETKLTTVEQVLAGWEMKGEVSCDYGSVVHKAVECAIKYNELPNNPHLLALAQDALDLLKDAEVSSEQFICSFEDKACGIVDCLVNLGNKRVKIIDFKGLALDTLIPTPTGFTTMGEIKVGDKLYDDEGNVTEVTEKSEVHHKKCYRLEFSSGDPVIADYDHRWVVLEKYGRGQKLTKRKVMTTEEIAKTTKPVRIPLTKSIKGKKKKLLVDPYVLGVWLGDGVRDSGTITTSDTRIWEEILERGYKISEPFHDKRGEKCEARTVYGLVGQLKKIGVYKNKHIPNEYLRASEQQRKDLLAGLLDTDGSYNKIRNEVTICTTKGWWENDLRELVASLGGKVTTHNYVTTGFGKRWKAKQFRIMTLFNPFGVKETDWCEGRGGEKHQTWRARRTFKYVTSCEEVPTVPTQCIKVKSSRHTYLFGRDFHVTHNTSDLDKKIQLTPEAKELWPELTNKLISIYHLQLSYYAYILTKMGYKVDSLEIWAESAEAWAITKLQPLDITKAIGNLQGLEGGSK